MVTVPDLPTDLVARYGPQVTDPSDLEHLQHHDLIDTLLRRLDAATSVVAHTVLWQAATDSARIAVPDGVLLIVLGDTKPGWFNEATDILLGR